MRRLRVANTIRERLRRWPLALCEPRFVLFVANLTTNDDDDACLEEGQDVVDDYEHYPKNVEQSIRQQATR